MNVIFRANGPTVQDHFLIWMPTYLDLVTRTLRSKLWAVAVDDGRLVFVDTEDLTIDPGFPRPAPNPNPDSAARTPAE